EEEHVTDALLETGGLVRQDEYRTFFAIADEPHAGPDINGLRDAIAALRNKEDAFARCFLDFVNGRLNRHAIVGIAVAANGKSIVRQVDGVGIIEPRRVKRLAMGWENDSKQDHPEHYELPHRSLQKCCCLMQTHCNSRQLGKPGFHGSSPAPFIALV